MIISQIGLKNWRNLREVDVTLGRNIFLVGPTASGKSNFLDAIRFLKDLASVNGGGLSRAVRERGGISGIRCFSSGGDSHIEIKVELSGESRKYPHWRYELGFTQEPRGYRYPRVAFERVWREDKLVIERPDVQDRKDRARLYQTYLEQTFANQPFRDMARFFNSILYFHLVPQVLRHPEYFTGPPMVDEPYGRDFLARIEELPERMRKKRLKQIEEALRSVVPFFEHLFEVKDRHGRLHIEAEFQNWRPNAGRQREERFSDGMLRLIGLFWALLGSEPLLLLEEPELSLPSAVIRQIPRLMRQTLKHNRKKRQIILSTHSVELLSDDQIEGNELLFFKPGKEGIRVVKAYDLKLIKKSLESGSSGEKSQNAGSAMEGVNQLRLNLFGN